jgi:putative two-component system response regulator
MTFTPVWGLKPDGGLTDESVMEPEAIPKEAAVDTGLASGEPTPVPAEKIPTPLPASVAAPLGLFVPTEPPVLQRVTPPASTGLESLTPASILLVDSVDINRHWLKGILKAGPYRITECHTPVEGLEVLQRESIDLIITDLLMPDFSGFEFCRRVKADRRTRLTPILVITSVQGIENEVAVLESGADEFLLKPLRPSVVRARIQTMLRNKRTLDSLEEAEAILFALAQTVEARDKETGNHCQRLAALSVALGTTLGLPQEDLIALHRGGYLHDIGKVSVPDAILFKKESLDEEDWLVMRNHTLVGERLCSRMKSLTPVLPIIRNHHERWDGSGYPDGLSGERIPLLARILQLADIYDALTSRRSYKQALPPDQALAVLAREAECGWRDPELVSVFGQMVQTPGFAENCVSLLDPEPVTPEDVEGFQLMRDSLARMSREVLR